MADNTGALQRIPLAGTITSRDSTLKKDALLFNCYAEQGDGGNIRAVRRFGTTQFASYTAGAGLGLFNFQEKALSVIGSTVRLDAMVLSTTVDTGSVYQFTPTTTETGFVLKNNLFGYVYDGSTFQQIPPASSGVKVQSISITNPGQNYSAAPTVVIAGGGGTGATATATMSGGQVTGVIITNGGNGYTSSPTVSFVNAAGDTTGAGAAGYATINANAYPDQTVPGVAYLDGFVFVLDTTGKVWNSAINNAALWDPLSYVSIQIPDKGVALTRHLNYIVAFGAYTTSFFYNNSNPPPGSPLLLNEAVTAKIGCACGTSVVTAENTVFWVGQHSQRGRSVYAFDGLVPVPISDPYIDRIISRDPLTTVSAFYIEISGHKFYYLTLPASNVTLVYDLTTKMWHVWSSLEANSLTLDGTIIETDGYRFTVVVPDHGLSNGDIITITGTGTTPPYVVNAVVSVVDRNTITFNVEKIPSISINSAVNDSRAINDGNLIFLLTPEVTITTYQQNYYPMTYYAFINNTDLLLGKSNGIIYQIGPDFWTDNGLPIYTAMRTSARDFGTNKRKFYQKAEVIGDKIQAYAYIGYSDDDYQTFSYFRGVNLEAARSQLRKCAASRRRAWEVVYIDQYPMRFYELELEVNEGMQ